MPFAFLIFYTANILTEELSSIFLLSSISKYIQ